MRFLGGIFARRGLGAALTQGGRVSLSLLQAHFDALDTLKLFQVLIFDAKVRPRGFVYYRADGPFEHVGSLHYELQLPLEASVLDVTGTRGSLKHRQFGVLMTPRFLPAEALRKHQLTVDITYGYMPLIAQYMETHRALAFAGTGAVNVKNDAYLLFRNPRRFWQFSTFSPGIGPTGHVESETVKGVLERVVALRRARPDDGAYLRQVMAAPDVFDEPDKPGDE